MEELPGNKAGVFEEKNNSAGR
jgi:hypothetical protein